MNFNAIPPVTKILLIINIAAFVICKLLMPNLNALFTAYFPVSPQYYPFQIISHMFMHGNFSHLFFNMFGLFMFGSPVENYFKEKKFLILYFASGLGAYLLHEGVFYLENKQIIDLIFAGNTQSLSKDALDYINYSGVLGASGAIFGVTTAFAVLYPNTPLMLIFFPVPIKAKYLVALYLGFELFSGMSGVQVGVAHFAHIGGAIIGFFLTRYWMKNRFLH